MLQLILPGWAKIADKVERVVNRVGDELYADPEWAGTLDEPPRPASAASTRRLTAEQDRVLASVGDPDVLYRLTAALNGFVARLSGDQVKRLRATDGVALVERSTTQRVASVDSPRFLGLDEAWAATGGPDEAGRGVVVGVVDTGIWPENPSFAALPGQVRPAGLRAACQPGQKWDRSTCTSKVVAARWFVEAFGEDNLASIVQDGFNNTSTIDQIFTER